MLRGVFSQVCGLVTDMARLGEWLNGNVSDQRSGAGEILVDCTNLPHTGILQSIVYSTGTSNGRCLSQAWSSDSPYLTQ